MVQFEIIPNGFKFLNHPRIEKKGSGLNIIYKKNLDVKYYSREFKLKILNI